MKNLTLSIIILSFSISCYAADSFSSIDYTFKGEVQTSVYMDSKQDDEFENKSAVDARIRLENTFQLKDINASIRFDLEGRAEYLQRDKSESEQDLTLGQAYLKLHPGNSDITIGKQVLTWGKLDDVVILDTINPQDYKQFVLNDKQDRKIPVFMFDYQYNADTFRIEGVYIPSFKPSYVRFFGSDWAVFGHLKQGVEEGGSAALAKSVVRKIRTERKEDTEDAEFKNGEAGLRFSSRYADIDYSLYYMNIFDRVAVLREKDAVGNTLKRFLYLPGDDTLASLVGSDPSAEELVLEEEYQRTHVIGKDFETVVGNFGVRGEAALFVDVPYLRDDFSYTRKKTFIVGIGIDHTTADNLYYNFQIIETLILNYAPLFAQERSSCLFTSNLSKEFLRGRFIVNLDSSFSPSYYDWMLNPELAYKFNNGMRLSVGGFIFEGSPTTVFGRFSAKDLVYLRMKYSF